MVIRSSRGWIRILEASIAVMVVIGALLFSFSSRPSVDLDSSSNGDIELILDKALSDIALDYSLNKWLFTGDATSNEKTKDHIANLLPSSFSVHMEKCDLNVPCVISDDALVRELRDLNVDIITRDTIISDPKVSSGDAKKLKLFVWGK